MSERVIATQPTDGAVFVQVIGDYTAGGVVYDDVYSSAEKMLAAGGTPDVLIVALTPAGTRWCDAAVKVIPDLLAEGDGPGIDGVESAAALAGELAAGKVFT